MVLSSWFGGLAFEGWILQVGCLVLVVSIGTFRSSDATLKTTAPDLEYAAPRTFAKWGLNTPSVGAVQFLLAEGGIRFLGITADLLRLC